MNDRIVTVFGGTGFLGRHVVRSLRSGGFTVRVASRHPDRADAPRSKDPADPGRHPQPDRGRSRAGERLGRGQRRQPLCRARQRYLPCDPRQRGAHHCARRARGRGRTADPGVRHRRRYRLAVALCAQARRRRAGGAVGVSRRGDRAPGGDVRRRRRLRHHRARSHAQASGLSDVRARADAAAAGRGRRRGGRHRAHPHAPGARADALRVRRAGRFHLRGFPAHRRARGRVAAAPGPVPVRRLASFGARRGRPPAPAGDAQPGRADGGRHRHLRVDAGAARARHHAAAGQGHGP